MLYIRPIRENDLDQLEELAQEAGIGLTTLPKERALLEKKITQSSQSFSPDIHSQGNQSYLFVLEDTEISRIIGTSGIIASVGTKKPFYSYKLGTLVHASEELNIFKEVKVLHLVNDFRKVTEICTLFLSRRYRAKGSGKLLSRSRFLFMSEFPERFSERIIAEMRGVQDEKGRSPFWRNLGMHFFDMNFSKADYLTTVGNKQFISDLMPRYPVYVPLLQTKARKVIGEVHEATRPALEMLHREGFRWEGYVDIFDAGPTIEAFLESISTVRESKRATIGQVVKKVDSIDYLISNTRLDFRACVGNLLEQDDQTVTISGDIATILEVERGDTIRYISITTTPY